MSREIKVSHDTKASSLATPSFLSTSWVKMIRVKYHVRGQKVHEIHQRYLVFLSYKILEIPASLLDNCFVTSV